jgi:hypothetical protein
LVLGLLSGPAAQKLLDDRGVGRGEDPARHAAPAVPGASWDAKAVREYVVEHLHDEEAVLAVDETGDLKKGTHTVEVQRQYTGTAGRIEDSQVAVYLVYAGERGHAVLDPQPRVPRTGPSPPGSGVTVVEPNPFRALRSP